MNYAKEGMWKAEKSGLNHVKQNSVKQISGFALFKPMLDQRLDFIENLLQIGCEGVAEMLKKVEEKKGKDGSISKAGNFR